MKPYPFSFENHLTVPISGTNVLLQTTSAGPVEPTRLTQAPERYLSTARVRKQTPPKPGGAHGRAEQHRDRHRPGATRHRRQVPGDLRDRGFDVAADALVGAGQADVQHGRSRLDHLRL